MKNAIAYDWIDSIGGIERVIPIISKELKNPDLYTSYYDPEKTVWANKFKIYTSFINRLPSFIKKNRILSLIFYPYAFESFNFTKYKSVLSITSSFSKSIITKPDTAHYSYILTPTRYFWINKNIYLKNRLLNMIGSLTIPFFKKWDFIAAQRPDKIATLSKFTQKLIKENYKRDSEIIYPPFDIDYWSSIKKNLKNKKIKSGFNYFLLVARLEPYKRVDLAIKTFNKIRNKLIIIGNGSQLKKLKRIANRNIKFINEISDLELAKYYKQANALIMPQSEEFGMVSLEAQFFGCPVISYIKSGTFENILNNKTGIFFNEQTTESLLAAIVRYKSMSYNLKKSTIRFGYSSVNRFNKNKFLTKFKMFMSL